ncbi:integrase core domain protein [Gracilaria domingensis]|nr:integrase core domain protein [Gracilaria domingensis]
METPPDLQERMALMHQIRKETNRIRAEAVLSQALSSFRRHVRDYLSLQVGQQVWFHRKRHGWRKGTITQINRLEVIVSHGSRIYPTHERRVRPYFGDVSLPPDVLDHEEDEFLSPGEEADTSPPQSSTSTPDPQSASSPQFVYTPSLPKPEHIPTTIDGDENPIELPGSPEQTCFTEDRESPTIIPNDVWITTQQFIKTTDRLSPDDKIKFDADKSEEIKFLMSNTVKCVPLTEIPGECEIQPLRWIVSIKRNPNSATHPVRHRARLITGSHISSFRHTLSGNAPTISIASLRILLAVTPTWNAQATTREDEMVVLIRDVTKAYLQSMPCKRLLFYQPAAEFYQEFSSHRDMVWKAVTQMYGDVEAGKYWYHTFVPWVLNNILDYNQCLSDPSLLLSPTQAAATALCTDDCLTIMPRKLTHVEAKIAKRFPSRPIQKLPTDFKGLDISFESNVITISQKAYAEKIDLQENKLTKVELERSMTDDEVSQLRSDAGKLAWLATGSSPISAFQASVALHRHEIKVAPKLHVLFDTRNHLETIRNENLAQLRYVVLDPDTVHIRVYSDGSFQNLRQKHSQIGFIICLADGNDNINIVHWHSSRAPRRPCSTEQSQLMALDKAFISLEKLKRTIIDLIKRSIPTVSYIDCETLWANLMNETVPTIPEICYRVREHITRELVYVVCLLRSDLHPADGTTKAKPNKALERIVLYNRCISPARKVFMFQDSRFRHCSFIPTTSVPMPQDALIL